MWRPSRRVALLLACAVALIGSVIALASADNSRARDPERSTPRAGERGEELPPDFDPTAYRDVAGTPIVDLPGGRHAVLSLDLGLQRHLEELLERYEVPRAGIVALQPATGRVLAYVSHARDGRASDHDWARDASAPSASVFKLITAAALIDQGVPRTERVCYSGGRSQIVQRDIEDHPRDRYCATLAEALGGSINSVFAKLADRRLTPETLERYASAFGFGHALPFDAATEASRMDVPRERLEFARTAAGFWHTHMSPLHGAVIAATLANDGVMPRVSIVDRVADAGGKPLSEHEPRDYRPVVPRATARTVGEMMRRTVTHGTSRSAFYDPRGRAFLPGIAVAGKTGSLSENKPYRAYSWWVGFAPADKPRIAVAALLVNGLRWRIKGSYAGREALRYYLVEKVREGKQG